jgi:hypothetical protein
MENTITIDGIYDTLVDYFGGNRIEMIRKYFKEDTQSFHKHLKKEYKVFVKLMGEATPMKITKNNTGAATIKSSW